MITERLGIFTRHNRRRADGHSNWEFGRDSGGGGRGTRRGGQRSERSVFHLPVWGIPSLAKKKKKKKFWRVIKRASTNIIRVFENGWKDSTVFLFWPRSSKRCTVSVEERKRGLLLWALWRRGSSDLFVLLRKPLFETKFRRDYSW